MSPELINKLMPFIEIPGISNVINLLQLADMPMQADNSIESLRSQLIALLKNLESDEKLCNVLHEILLNLAELYPINETDPIDQNNIHLEDAVFISSGEQFNIYELIQYHNTRAYRGSSLGESPNRKYLLNPLTNEKFLGRDEKHILNIARKKRIKVDNLMANDEIRNVSAFARGMFYTPNFARNGTPRSEQVGKMRALVLDHFDYDEIIGEFLDAVTARNFLTFFENERANEILKYFSRDAIFTLSFYHIDVVDLITQECLDGLEKGLFTVSQVTNLQDAQKLLALTCPASLAAMTERSTSFAMLQYYEPERIREMNRGNEAYPALPSGFLEIAEPLQTQLLPVADKISDLVKVEGITIERLINLPLRDTLISNSWQVITFTQAGLSLETILNANEVDRTLLLKVGMAIKIHRVSEDTRVQPEHFSRFDHQNLSELLDLLKGPGFTTETIVNTLLGMNKQNASRP